jgi:CheY-like chemotaxis protein
LELTCAIAENVSQKLIGDTARLRQILLNLIGNAVKFTEQGEVALEITRVSETDKDIILHFAVRDTGMGIPEDVQKNLFRSFTQADASTTRKFGGTGLGLAICRKLVELMGGTIGLNSTYGQGSTFWFTLPYTKQKISALPASATPLKSAGGGSAVAAPALAIHTRVVLAEDNKINQIVGMKQLKKLGCTNIQLVGNGLEAVAAWRQDPTAIILMDCQMPELDGYEATRQIRQLEKEQNLPRTRIIAMTANAMQGDRELCLDAGMDDYISKPVDMDELKKALKANPAAAEPQVKVTTVETAVEEPSSVLSR